MWSPKWLLFNQDPSVKFKSCEVVYSRPMLNKNLGPRPVRDLNAKCVIIKWHLQDTSVRLIFWKVCKFYAEKKLGT